MAAPATQRLGPRWSNCLLWALGMWLRHGGYVVVRRTRRTWLGGRRGWWPHALWSPDGREHWSYVPPDGQHRFLPPPLFRGEVREAERRMP